jgi:hypothetical protein
MKSKTIFLAVEHNSEIERAFENKEDVILFCDENNDGDSDQDWGWHAVTFYFREAESTTCACGNNHPLVAEFGACGKCMEAQL